MKYFFSLISFILLSLTFYSCYDEETSPSCLTIDKENNYKVTSQIYEIKEIEFDLLNECDYDYTIIDYDVSGDIKDIILLGLSKNEIIKSKKISFKIIVSPQYFGNKTISFSILTDIGQMYVSVGINVE